MKTSILAISGIFIAMIGFGLILANLILALQKRPYFCPVMLPLLICMMGAAVSLTVAWWARRTLRKLERPASAVRRSP